MSRNMGQEKAALSSNIIALTCDERKKMKGKQVETSSSSCSTSRSNSNDEEVRARTELSAEDKVERAHTDRSSAQWISMMRRGQHGARRGRARVRCDPRWSSSAHRTKRHTELGAEDEEESSARRISMMRRWLGFPRALTELLGVEDEEEGWGELGAGEWARAELSTGWR